jgi:hypothetical protein
MPIRLLALALLAGSSIAFAAPRASKPPKAEPAPQQSPETIDVDAMARAKDVDAAASDAPSATNGNGAADETPADETAAAPPASDQSSTDANAPSRAALEAPPTDASASSAQASDEPPPADESASPQPTSGESSADAASTAESAPSTSDVPTEAASAPVDAPTQTDAPTPEAAATPSDVSQDAAPSDAAQAAAPPDASQSDAAPPDAAERSIAAGCESRAAGLLDDAQKADYGSATRDFDAKMRSELPAPRFQQQWESLAQFGKLVARGQSHLGRGEGYTIVVIPLIFEKANLVAQIACGSDGRIAGFHVTQAPKPQF